MIGVLAELSSFATRNGQVTLSDQLANTVLIAEPCALRYREATRRGSV